MSVIIPAFNASAYLSEAIESVLAQTHGPTEVIVVDDGSTDGTADLASAFGDPVTVVSQSNLGCAAARNAGVRSSRSEFVSFLDADDLWDPQKLEKQFAALDLDPRIDLLFGEVVQFRSPELAADLVHLPEGAEVPRPGHHAGTLLLTRRTFDTIGGFDQNLGRTEFLDFFARAVDQSLRLAVVEGALMLRRLHLSNFGLTTDVGPEEYAQVLRQVIERRRKLLAE